jgi:hypothetical protein
MAKSTGYLENQKHQSHSEQLATSTLNHARVVGVRNSRNMINTTGDYAFIVCCARVPPPPPPFPHLLLLEAINAFFHRLSPSHHLSQKVGTSAPLNTCLSTPSFVMHASRITPPDDPSLAMASASAARVEARRRGCANDARQYTVIVTHGIVAKMVSSGCLAAQSLCLSHACTHLHLQSQSNPTLTPSVKQKKKGDEKTHLSCRNRCTLPWSCPPCMSCQRDRTRTCSLNLRWKRVDARTFLREGWCTPTTCQDHECVSEQVCASVRERCKSTTKTHNRR